MPQDKNYLKHLIFADQPPRRADRNLCPPPPARDQVRFVKHTKGAHAAFRVMDVRATVPESPAALGEGDAAKSAGASAAAAMAGAAS